MKLNIADEKENPLLKRKELSIEIEHDSSATPSRAALQQLVSKQLNKDAEFIDVRSIFSGRGAAKSKAKVFVWEEKKAEDLSKASAPASAEPEKKEEVKEKQETAN